MAMKKEDFEPSGICDKKAEEIINCSTLKAIDAFRVIKKHDKDQPIVYTDFTPSFIECNSNLVPSVEKQEKFKKLESFGVSVYDTKKHILDAQDLVPSLRNHPISQGKTDVLKGSIGKPDQNGHYQYYLFDYLNNSPCVDFHYVDEEEE